MHFYDIFTQSTRGVEDIYFNRPVDGGNPKELERVYCYELYAQIRKNWSSEFEYTVSGEVDKSGHVLMGKLGLRQVKPDILIHTPGNMQGNLIIIEVKRAQNLELEGIRKDIKTLSKFVTRGYPASEPKSG